MFAIQLDGLGNMLRPLVGSVPAKSRLVIQPTLAAGWRLGNTPQRKAQAILVPTAG